MWVVEGEASRPPFPGVHACHAECSPDGSAEGQNQWGGTKGAPLGSQLIPIPVILESPASLHRTCVRGTRRRPLREGELVSRVS